MPSEKRDRIPKDVGKSMITVALIFDVLKFFLGIMQMTVGLIVWIAGAMLSMGVSLIPFVGWVLGPALTVSNTAVGIAISIFGGGFAMIITIIAFLKFHSWYSSCKVKMFEHNRWAQIARIFGGVLVPFSITVSVYLTIRKVRKADREYNAEMEEKNKMGARLRQRAPTAPEPTPAAQPKQMPQI